MLTILSRKASALEPGVWYRENGNIRNTGTFILNHALDDLPYINRDLTRWELYNKRNGNFKVVPGAYTMAGAIAGGVKMAAALSAHGQLFTLLLER